MPLDIPDSLGFGGTKYWRGPANPYEGQPILAGDPKGFFSKIGTLRPRGSRGEVVNEYGFTIGHVDEVRNTFSPKNSGYSIPLAPPSPLGR